MCEVPWHLGLQVWRIEHLARLARLDLPALLPRRLTDLRILLVVHPGVPLLSRQGNRRPLVRMLSRVLSLDPGSCQAAMRDRITPPVPVAADVCFSK